MKNVIIIGGGITGLAAAYQIQQEARATGQPISFTLLESNNRIGGKIKTERVDGFTIDGGPDCFLSRKPWGIELCRNLGLNDALMGTNDDRRKTFVLNKGKLTPLPDGVMLIIPTRMVPFLTTRLISWPGKIRMGMDMFIPPRRDESDETVGSFVRRRLGSEAMDKIAEPLMSGIHISDPEYQSLLASFPLFREMERKYGSLIRAMLARKKSSAASNGKGGKGSNGAGGMIHPSPTVERLILGGLRAVTGLVGVPLKGTAAGAAKATPPKSKAKGLYHEGPLPMFMSLKEGLGQMIAALGQALAEGPGTIHLGKQAVSLEQCHSLNSDEPRYRVHTADGDSFEGDAVIMATPAYVSAGLLGEIDPVLSGSLQSIRYVTTATASLGFNLKDVGQPFDGFGFVIPRKENRQISGCTWSSTKFNYRVADDKLLLRCFIGGPGREDLAEKPDDELLDMVRGELRSIMGLQATPVLTRIFRWTKANPQYDVGHIERVRDMQARCEQHAGLFLTGSAYDGVGVPDCIRQGQSAAKKAIASITQLSAVDA